LVPLIPTVWNGRICCDKKALKTPGIGRRLWFPARDSYKQIYFSAEWKETEMDICMGADWYPQMYG
jgi:hypothetical protein